MNSTNRPDHSSRPLQMTCEHLVDASQRAVFFAWTEGLDCWFAQPGTLSLLAAEGRPYFFYNRDEWGRHPHYGRFLEVTQNQTIEMTWVTGNGAAEGTEGAETILRIDIIPKDDATLIRLNHSGFVSEKSQEAHRENWPIALELLGEALRNDSKFNQP